MIKFCRLLLVLLASVAPCDARALSEFFEYGSNAADWQFPTMDDGTVKVAGTYSFPYYNATSTSMWLNTNGYISLDSEVTGYTPVQFPIGGSKVIAVFWADLDLTDDGGELFYRMSTTVKDRSKAQAEVRKHLIPSFTPTRVFVATWKAVAAFGMFEYVEGECTDYDDDGECSNYEQEEVRMPERNTFQLVLTTDGHNSVVIFNYNKIEWLVTDTSQKVQAGFNAGDAAKRYMLQPGSFTSGASDWTTKSNVGVPGMWMYRVDTAKISVTLPPTPPPTPPPTTREPTGTPTERPILLAIKECYVVLSNGRQQKNVTSNTWFFKEFHDVSRVIVVGDPSCSVTLFGVAEYRGINCKLTPGTYNRAETSCPEETWSVLVGSPPCRMTLYEHSDHSGMRITVWETMSRLPNFHRKTSSVEIEGRGCRFTLQESDSSCTLETGTQEETKEFALSDLQSAGCRNDRVERVTLDKAGVLQLQAQPESPIQWLLRQMELAL